MDEQKFLTELIDFISKSPTPFHAVANMKASLLEAGFEILREDAPWKLNSDGRYIITRNDSSIIGLCLNNANLQESGVRMVGAHSDSPCLRIKPQPGINKHQYFQLGVEVYGGALLNPWFDRDLALAGRLHYRDNQTTVKQTLIDFRRAIAVVPSLAIHLDLDANKNRTINAQEHIPPLLCIDKSAAIDFNDMLLQQLNAENPQANAVQLLSHELYLYDSQPPALIGLNQDFIAGARLDNLLSCYVALYSLIHSAGNQANLLICNDHEEVGSVSFCGAEGNFLSSVLQRINPSAEDYARCMHHCVLVSTDNTHGIHPNYADRHDHNHGPILNAGPVVKINSSQRYASNSATIAQFSCACSEVDVPLQQFVVRSDMACGSTIGPITAKQIGVNTVDVGVPSLAMHSIRELAGSQDAFFLYKALKHFFTDDKMYM